MLPAMYAGLGIAGALAFLTETTTHGNSTPTWVMTKDDVS